MTHGDCFELIEDGYILVNGSTIECVGKFDETSVDPAIPITHLVDQLIIPGFVNCHTHSGMSLLRGFADDVELHEWLSDAVWPVERKFISPQYVRLGTQLAIYELLKTGTTTFVDQYFECQEAAEVAEEAGIRIACGEPILDFNDGSLDAQIEDAFRKISDLSSKHDPKYVIPVLNTHSCYTVPAESLEFVSIRRPKETRIHIHLHESQHECDHYADTHGGKTAFETLIDAGLFNSNMIAAHCVCLSDAERRMLAQHKINVVHCPKSNMKLATGVCPVQGLINMGVNVALGTDGACSNNGLSMISEMQAAALVGKTVNCKADVSKQHTNGGDATAVSCHTVLRMATYNGAIALGIQDKVGSLAPGKWADMVAIDLSGPECQPVYDPVSSLVYSTGASVSHVWIGGRLKVRNGIVIANVNLDMQAVKAVAREIAQFKKDRNMQRNIRCEKIATPPNT